MGAEFLTCTVEGYRKLVRLGVGLATFSSVCHRVVGALGANGVMVEVAFALKVYSLDDPIV